MRPRRITPATTARRDGRGPAKEEVGEDQHRGHADGGDLLGGEGEREAESRPEEVSRSTLRSEPEEERERNEDHRQDVFAVLKLRHGFNMNGVHREEQTCEERDHPRFGE